MGQDGTFDVLVVCAANQCRSPLAEHLLRASLRDRAIAWSVSSAGVAATPGVPVYPPVLEVLAARGLDARNARSRAIDADIVERADLILTAESVHRAMIVSRFPSAVARTFTLRQFARLAEWVSIRAEQPVTSGEELLRMIAVARTYVGGAPPEDDDIADPVGRSRRAMRRCEREVDAAVHAILSPLGSAATSIMGADDGATSC